MNKVLTIVVPVYNTEQYLSKCLDSLIVKENKELIEVLVVIDGSPDNSLQIATEYSLKYPDLFRVINKENGGHGSCCNRGIQEAKGKYIKFLDSDDWFELETLSYLIHYLKNVDVDVFFTKSVKELIYENRTQNYGCNFNYSNEIICIEDLEIPIDTNYPHFFTLADCGFKTNMLHNLKITFSEKCSFDDTFLYFAPFINTKKILFINKILYHYLIGRSEQSIISLSPLKYHQKAQEYIKCLKVCNQFNDTISQNIKLYVKNFAGILIDNCYFSIFNSQNEIQKQLYIDLQNTIKKNSLLSQSSSKYHYLLKYIPFYIAKLLYTIRKAVKEVVKR